MMNEPLRAGVIGVGSMGQNHARAYAELGTTSLEAVFDVDTARAEAVAARHGTVALEMDDFLAAVDIASIAVPTAFHYEMARQCIEAGVHVLVEKPFVDNVEEGRELIRLAEEHGVVLQVGHIERFNPIVAAIQELVEDLDVIAVTAERLGPPPKREIDDTAVMDLMIHDLDIVLDLLEGDVVSIGAAGTADGRYGTATLSFDTGTVANLTASRITQEKVRQLTISAEDCRVKVDYINQTAEIHRASTPEYVKESGTVSYHHESIVEQLTVERHEPLKEELRCFAKAAQTGSEPEVTGADGLRVVELAHEINTLAYSDKRKLATANSD
ncbi:Gfo/Idh/MocA family oxidoreductase (plasmid) [Haloferacaceae archaeon DSL9]